MTKLPIIVQTSRKMVTSITPWLSSRPNHQRSASPVDVKKAKQIETFKPKRIPLAELDINCFTPSPTQQEALRRNSGPWLANPVPRQYLNHSATEPEQLSQSAPQSIRNQAVRTFRAPTISEPRPPKRARLCADIETVESPSRMVELGRSRFFTSAGPEPSPTAGRNVRSKPSKNQEIGIFSDDSIEEAMLSLPDIDGFGNTGPRSGKKIPIFKEQTANCGDKGRPGCLKIQDTARQADSQNTTPSLTTPASAISSAEQPPTAKEANLVPDSDGSLKSRFAFGKAGVSTPKPYSGLHHLPSSSSLASRPSRIPLAFKSNTPAPKLTMKANLTPLQRLGATAANRAKPPITLSLTPIYTGKPKSPRRSLFSKTSVPFPEVEREAKPKKIEPASVPLPIPDEAENAALNMQSGSEDLIIHDSEEDEYELNSQIDLGRFFYATQARSI
jgi:exonuclease-1